MEKKLICKHAGRDLCVWHYELETGVNNIITDSKMCPQPLLKRILRVTSFDKWATLVGAVKLVERGIKLKRREHDKCATDRRLDKSQE